jgi:phage-related protein
VDNWIRDLITQAIGPVRDAVTAIFARIAVIWSAIIAVGTNLRNAWRYFVNAARHKLAQLRGLVSEMWATMAWLIKIRIPQAIGVAVDGIVNWTLRTISNARNALEAAISSVVTWARARLGELQQFLSDLTQWIRETVADIRATLGYIVRIVSALLTDPAHMAEWLFGALVRKVLSYIDTNAEALFDLLLQRGIYYAGKVANRLEEMLVRLL